MVVSVAYLRCGRRVRCFWRCVRAFQSLQEAARQDPDNSEYRGLIKKYKLMESTKEAGNKAFKANDLEGAIRSWGEALTVDKTNKSFNSKLYCNRAAAYAKVMMIIMYMGRSIRVRCPSCLEGRKNCFCFVAGRSFVAVQ